MINGFPPADSGDVGVLELKIFCLSSGIALPA